LQSGEAIGCFGLTEPDHGSDPGSMKTRALKKGNEYVLNGTKLWITNGSIADVAVVWAREDDGEISGFLVEKGTPGYATLDIHGKFSMRASITSELSFQDCRIPAENRFPGVRGLRGPLGCLNQARYGIAWGAVGAAMAVYDWALQYAQQRIQFGKPIASFQLVQQKLVWMVTEITKAQLLCLQLGRLKDQGQARPQQVSMAKMNNVRALDCAHGARHARRQRHHRRVPVHAPHVQPRVGLHLRGHARHPHADPGRGCDGDRGLPVRGRSGGPAGLSAPTCPRVPRRTSRR
jgi:glutaryl-CoA dehydrogenase